MKKVVILFLLVSLSGLYSAVSPNSVFGQQQPTPAPARPVTAARKVTQFVEKSWPRSFTTASGANVVMHQPQIATWDDQKHLVGYSAISYLAGGETEKPALGTVKMETDTQVSITERMVKFTTVKITEANFQSLPKDQTREIINEIEKTIPDEDRIISLDRVLTSIDKSQIIPKNAKDIKADPPTIFFSKTSAILLNVDGDPIWSPIRENDLKFAVNTNWDLFQHGPTNTYYVRNENSWLKASDLKGPWVTADKLPSSFKKLPNEENWKDVRESLKVNLIGPVPKVFFSTQPAELIALRGEPIYQPVGGTGAKLLWVSNTDSDVFRLGETGPIYYLVAGRWFSSTSFNGPWTFATPNLPDAFKKIPLEHPRSRVLAAVPGTEQAYEAVLFAMIPQTARVNKKEVKAPEVKYNGNPEYAPIEGTSLARAVNTDRDIIKVGDLYYMCFDGIWFMGRSPNGPWAVADSVPKEIYEIPASSQAHNVTYVTVQEDENKDDDWVEFAAVAGYTGMMVGWGCSMWGTGWYYPPYYWYGGYYPIYYPPLRTFGYGSWYNPLTGFYGSAGRIYGPYGGIGFGARYNPSTGTYARGAMAWGPYGARGAAQIFNPRTGTIASTRQGSNVFGSWGSTSVIRGDQWAQTKRFTNAATGNTTRVTRTDQGTMVRRKGEEGSGFIGKGQDNVYAGKDGNVYRKDDSGNWSKWENGSWNNVQKPDKVQPLNDKARDKAAKKMDTSTFDGLQRDSAKRSEGNNRAKDYSSYKNRGGGNAGSYRGGGFSGGRGGGFRGGGRR